MSVPDQQAGDAAHIVLANIYMHNASGILGVFEWPLSAHDDYKKNRWLVRKVLKGFGPSKNQFPKEVPETFSCDCVKTSP